jgi:hypothetical protein
LLHHRPKVDRSPIHRPAGQIDQHRERAGEGLRLKVRIDTALEPVARVGGQPEREA